MTEKTTVGKFVEDSTKDMPSGIDRTILGILMYHVGKENAISRDELLVKSKLSWDISDRGLRDQINSLKKSEFLICSTGGVGGGYYLAQNWDELEDYIGHELLSRIKDLSEQRKSLQLGGKKLWGENSPQIDLL